jgi:hypothetical protein
LKVYNISAVPSLLCGCEIWTLKPRNIRRIKKTEMKFLRRTAEYRLLDSRRNELILEELNVGTVARN